MIITYSINGVPIRLTDERWNHILRRHPEMAGEKDKVIETIKQPHLVQEGDHGTLLAIRQYPQTSLTQKHVVVVYREVSTTDGFIIMAYLTNHPAAWRKVLWKQ
jgi:hypothetical protein